MGFDLTSDSGLERRVSGAGWALLLNVAQTYGWKPSSPVAPENEEADPWLGDYDSNDGQRVTKQGAANFASGLELALADPRRRERQAAISVELDRLMYEMEVAAYGLDQIGPFRPSPGPDGIPDVKLQDFIAFLRAGAFRIDQHRFHPTATCSGFCARR
jgi:hypothetical protein